MTGAGGLAWRSNLAVNGSMGTTTIPRYLPTSSLPYRYGLSLTEFRLFGDIILAGGSIHARIA
jgi:hypothetical protein